MHKIFLLLATTLFSSLALAAKLTPQTPCGVILSRNPLFAEIEASVLDQPRVQDLALMRAGPLLQPILLVGEMGTQKAKLLNALLQNSAQSNVPTFVFSSNGVSVKMAGVTTRRQQSLSSMLGEIPNGSFVILDYSPSYFQGPTPGSGHWDRLRATLESLMALKKKGDITAILTMRGEMFNSLSREPGGRALFDRFDIIRMAYGRSPQPAAQ